MTQVEVRGLTKEFGRTSAVRDMAITAPAGKVIAFLGPNGSGKTTTLRMVLGLLRAAFAVAAVLTTPNRDVT